jgi:hypothetical protein
MGLCGSLKRSNSSYVVFLKGVFVSIYQSIEAELSEVDYPNQRVRTSQVRGISAKVYKTLESKDIHDVLLVCEKLLEKRDWVYGVIAYDWAFRVKSQYTLETFSTLNVGFSRSLPIGTIATTFVLMRLESWLDNTMSCLKRS